MYTMTNKDKIVCIGSLNVDITLFVDEFCSADEERGINNILISSGGAAANIASGIGRLNKNVYFFGNIGTDSHTKMLLDDFEKDNVKYNLAKITTNPNNSCYSIVNKNSQRIMYAYNHVEFSEKDFPKEFYNEHLKYLIFTSLNKTEIISEYEKIAINAKKHNTKIVFSPGNIFVKFGFEKIKKMISLSKFLILSETEFNLLNKDVKELLKLCPQIIITYGKEGIEYHELNKTVKKFKAYKIKNPIDSTGAGDCFLAAFISNLASSNNVEKSIEFGVKAAAISVTKKGARSMPNLEELESLRVREKIAKES